MKSAQEFLALHAAYLSDPEKNPRPEGMGFNLRSANLSSANLPYANLSFADLSFANLRSANLRFADLCSADLCSADLRSADLRFASLSLANLSSANLSLANLSSANLSSANLSSANLSFANLSFADLSSANLSSTRGQRYAQVSFSGHGESGRQLLALDLPDGPRLFCGCFSGSEADLRDFISSGEERYRASRTLALDTVIQLLRA